MPNTQTARRLRLASRLLHSLGRPPRGTEVLVPLALLALLAVDIYAPLPEVPHDLHAPLLEAARHPQPFDPGPRLAGLGYLYAIRSTLLLGSLLWRAFGPQ